MEHEQLKKFAQDILTSYARAAGKHLVLELGKVGIATDKLQVVVMILPIGEYKALDASTVHIVTPDERIGTPQIALREASISGNAITPTRQLEVHEGLIDFHAGLERISEVVIDATTLVKFELDEMQDKPPRTESH